MTTTAHADRLLSIDALRGLTVAAMIVVNTPGSWSFLYPPLRHAAWHGLTPTDLVFPFFLFIVGISVALAFGKQLAAGAAPNGLRKKVLVRAAKIFGVGLLLSLWPEFNVGEFRWAGVLQRIALVFAACSFLFLSLRWRGLLAVTVLLLTGYWALLTCVPVPLDAVGQQALNTGKVERAYGEQVAVHVQASLPASSETDDSPRSVRALLPNTEPGTNLAAWVDRRLLPGRRYETTWDPEGLLSTLPALATALLGTLTGLWLRATPTPARRLRGLAIAGACLLASGLVWGSVFPLNKNLWTSSFVLVTAGWAMLALLVCSLVVDKGGWSRLALPARVFGSNAILAYSLASALAAFVHRPWGTGPSTAGAVMAALQGAGASPEAASLGFALLFTALIFLPLIVLYRRGIFLRL